MTQLSPIRLTLQAEGAAIAAVSILAYAQLGGSWIMFAVLILSPDLFMLGYLAGPRIGAFCYNLGHSYLTPLALAAGAWVFDSSLGFELALIWVTHIAADRAIGYGLKYATHFKDTHLNRAG